MKGVDVDVWGLWRGVGECMCAEGKWHRQVSVTQHVQQCACV